MMVCCSVCAGSRDGEAGKVCKDGLSIGVLQHCTASGDGEAGKVCKDGLSIGVLQRCTGSGDGEAGTAAGGHTAPQHGPED